MINHMSLYLIEDAVCQFVKQSDCENVKNIH